MNWGQRFSGFQVYSHVFVLGLGARVRDLQQTDQSSARRFDFSDGT